MNMKSLFSLVPMVIVGIYVIACLKLATVGQDISEILYVVSEILER